MDEDFMEIPDIGCPMTVEIPTLSAYINYLEDNCSAQDEILFRGQREDRPLLPKLARLVPRGILLTNEREMIDRFLRHSVPFLQNRPDNMWDWLALAQHHGMATRLLDWSLNPLAGLWFAVEKPAREAAPGVVWILTPDEADFVVPGQEVDPFLCKRTMVLRPSNVAARISAQLGCFTTHQCYEQEPYFLPLTETPGYGSKLTKVVIPASSFSTIRYQLDRCGVNHSALFPGLDGLCKYIEWLNVYEGDELE